MILDGHRFGRGLTRRQAQRLIARFQAGESLTDLARVYGVTPETAEVVLRVLAPRALGTRQKVRG